MTEPFFLSVFQVLQVTEAFSSGSNRPPLLVRAVNEADGNRADCALKPNGGERMEQEAMLRDRAIPTHLLKICKTSFYESL
jgi:hypothetical protein